MLIFRLSRVVDSGGNRLIFTIALVIGSGCMHRILHPASTGFFCDSYANTTNLKKIMIH